MNWSLYTADRSTHLKVLVSLIGISAAQLNLGTDIMTAQGPTVIKAGGPVVVTDQSRSIIR
jgi:hypothetical protein